MPLVFLIEFFLQCVYNNFSHNPQKIWSLPNWKRSWKLMKIKLYATSKLDEYCHNPNIRFVIKCGV